MIPRWLVYASAGVLLAAGIGCFLAASIEWGNRASLVDPLPGEATEQAGFVLVMYAFGAVNIAAALALVLLRKRIVWGLVVGLEAALFLLALVEGALTDPPGWVAFSSLPLATLVLLVALRVAGARLRPPMAT